MPVRLPLAISAILAIGLSVTACVVAHEEDNGETTKVAVSTPLGALTARTGEGSGDTGLPVYPGAQLSRDGGDGDLERANVSIGTQWFGLHVVAAEYDSAESPDQILAFYRDRLRMFGAVTECRGDLDFDDGRIECRPQTSSDQVQLLVGEEKNHHIVSVSPRGRGTQFALISFQMGTK